MMSKFANRPIPIRDNAPTTQRLAQVKFAANDPRSAESLVDLRSLGIAGENYYSRRDGGNIPYCRSIKGAIDGLFVRASVADMLARVNTQLRAINYALYVYDGYRPVECQAGIWEFFWEKIRAANAGTPDSEIEQIVKTYVSDPRRFNASDSSTWPLHTTGGAVDLTLQSLSADHLSDMGTHFDDASVAAHTDFFERELLADRIDATDQRLVNRRILFWTMRNAGFTNYPYEYWHFDYGDQMYALVRSESQDNALCTAFYPYINCSALS